MAQDPRRLDDIVATVRKLRSDLDGLSNASLNRIATHTHTTLASPATVTNLTVSGTFLGAGLYVCTTSTRPSSPVAGQMIYETDTKIIGYYTGSAWIELWSAGDTTTIHEAEYLASGGQAIATNTDTPLQFASSNYTTSDVTVGTSTSGSLTNAKFTLNRAGLWQIDGGCRTSSVTSGKSYGIWLGPDNGTTRFAAHFQSAGGTDSQEFAISCTRRFSLSAALNLYFWHDQGTSHTTTVLNQSNHIRLTWLRA